MRWLCPQLKLSALRRSVKISELENHLAILPSSSDRPTELEASQSYAFEFFTDNVKETVNTLQNDLQELNAKVSLLMRNANNLISDLRCLRLDGLNSQNPGPIYGGNIDAKEVDENFLLTWNKTVGWSEPIQRSTRLP